MPLKFECHQDFRLMKIANGKKYCESCKKHVHDVRKKDLSKINELVSSGDTCIIIYEEQLRKLEALRNIPESNSSQRGLLPYAAGLAALSLLPLAMQSQSSLSKEPAIKSERRAFGQLEINLYFKSTIAKSGHEIELYVNDAKFASSFTDENGAVTFSILEENVSKVKIRLVETAEFRIIENQGKFLSRCIRFESYQKEKTEKVVKEEAPFKIHGKLIFLGKKLKIKAGKEIFIYKEGFENEEDSLIGKLTTGLGGNFNTEIDKDLFEKIQQEHRNIYFRVGGYGYANYTLRQTKNNTLYIDLYKRKRRAFMGKF